MNFEETVVGKLAEVYQTVHLKEFTDFPKKDEKDPTTVFTDIHFEKKSTFRTPSLQTWSRQFHYITGSQRKMSSL